MEKSQALLIQALQTAAQPPEEHLLYKTGKQDGLFNSRNGEAGQAAEQALAEGYLELLRTEQKGKASYEWVRLTPRGLQFLAQQESPKAVLEELLHALRLHQQGMPDWVSQIQSQLFALVNRFQETMDRHHRYLNQLEKRAEDALRKLQSSSINMPANMSAWQLDMLEEMDQQNSVQPAREWLLADLYQVVHQQNPDLNLSSFHDGIKHLRDRGAITLLPWDQDFRLLQEPEYALMDEGKVYFAVCRA